MHQHVHQVVHARVRAALGDVLHGLVPGAGHHLDHGLLGRAQVLVAEAEDHVGLLDVALVVLLGRADEGADHPRDDGGGDLVDELDLLAARDPVEHPVDDPADPLLVLGDPLRREAALEQGLDPVVARRVHRDHLLLLALERDPEVVEDHDPADVGGERLPVQAHAAQVLGPGQRPEAGLVGVLVERAPVHRRLAAQAGEELVRRAVGPELEVAEVDLAQLALRHHAHVGHTTDVVATTRTAPKDRRAAIADAALEVLEAEGGRGLTHRAVDRRAGLPEGSTSNYFQTREALLTAALSRLVELERPSVEAMKALVPDGPYEPHRAAELVADLVRSWLTPGSGRPRASPATSSSSRPAAGPRSSSPSTRSGASTCCSSSSSCRPRAVATRTATRRSCWRCSTAWCSTSSCSRRPSSRTTVSSTSSSASSPPAERG